MPTIVRTSSLRKLLKRRPLWVILLVATAGIFTIALYAYPPHRSYLIEARTTSLEITVSGNAHGVWQFSDAVLCERLPRAVRGRAPRTDFAREFAGKCDPQAFEAISLPENAEFKWPAGTRLRIRRSDTSFDADLLIQVLESGYPAGETENGKADRQAVTVTSTEYDASTPRQRPELTVRSIPPLSLVVVPQQAWLQAGTLLFSGTFSLGAVPGNGNRDVLLEGRYEILEVPSLEALFGILPFVQANTRPVKTGTFFKGDQLRLLHKGTRENAEVNGFILSSGPEEPGFNTLIFGPTGRSVLTVDRFGAVGTYADPGASSAITPSWTDRAINDPYLLALSALFALIYVLVEITRAIHDWIWGQNKRLRRNRRRS